MIVARRPGDWIARLVLGVPVLTRCTSIVSIEGRERVTGVVDKPCRAAKRIHRVRCGVIIESWDVRSGDGNAARVAMHIEIDSGTGGAQASIRIGDAPIQPTTSLETCSVPSNIQARQRGEGALAARSILKGLDGTKLSAPEIAVKAGNGLRYIYPQRLTPEGGPVTLFGRVSQNCRGRLVVNVGGQRLSAAGHQHAARTPPDPESSRVRPPFVGRPACEHRSLTIVAIDQGTTSTKSFAWTGEGLREGRRLHHRQIRPKQRMG